MLCHTNRDVMDKLAEALGGYSANTAAYDDEEEADEQEGVNSSSVWKVGRVCLVCTVWVDGWTASFAYAMNCVDS